MIEKRVQELIQPPSSATILEDTPSFSKSAYSTGKVAEDIDLLEDHLMGIASMVGIDVDNAFLNSNFHGADEDRETLLTLMAQTHSSPPLGESNQDLSTQNAGDFNEFLDSFQEQSQSRELQQDFNQEFNQEFNQDLLDLNVIQDAHDDSLSNVTSDQDYIEQLFTK